jgi:tetratricopeptide (TPR) repeat protein
MADETKEKPTLDIESALDRTEQYIEDNKKSLMLIIGGVVVLVGIFLGWKYLYVQPRSEEASSAMYKAELVFAKDSFNLAANGKGDIEGFESIADEYGMTSSGKLANFYLGISYMRTGKFDAAIEALKDFDCDDKIIGTQAIGLLGDAYMEKGQVDDAIEQYLKAAKREPNKFTSPLFLKKAAFAYEDKGNKIEALKLYEQIKSEFPESQEAASIDKFVVRAGGEVK